MSAHLINKSPQITLASSSPRRRELLEQIMVSYAVEAVDIDESHQAGETPEQYVKRLALEKARAGYGKNPDRPALGSDTMVVLGQSLLGKPQNREMAIEMLSRLSGQRHQVMTAVAMVNDKQEKCLINISEVEFARLTQQQIDDYWETGEAEGKAGAYGVQGIAAQFISRINGSYSSIMGLPLYETAELLKQFGIDPLQAAKKTKE